VCRPGAPTLTPTIAARLPFMGVLLKKDHDIDVAQRALTGGRGRR
jgi:hypothetical protein